MRRFRLLVSLLVSAVLASNALAALPVLINYQGVLTDPSGQPLAPVPVQVQFRFYPGFLPTVLYSESHTVTPVNGRINVVLGMGAPLGGTEPNLGQVFLLNDDVQMGIRVGADAEMTPRLPVNSVAFAIRASDSDLLDGQSYSDILTAINSAVAGVSPAWSSISGKPAGFADNTDNDLMAGLNCGDGLIAKRVGGAWACASDANTLGGLFCASGKIARWNGSNWICDDDADSLASLSCTDGLIVKRASGAWGCGSDLDTLATLTCPSGQIPKRSGAVWICASDGLTAGGTCINGSVVKWNGSSWVCGTDLTTSYSAGVGISISGVTISLKSTGCADGALLKWNLGLNDWQCVPDNDTLRGLSCSPTEIPRWDGANWVCSTDNDALGNLTCSNGKIVERVGGIWACGDDNEGVTSVATGTGLTGGTITTTGTLSLKPAAAAEIGGVRSISCPAGQFISTISTAGVPTCTAPAVAWPAGSYCILRKGGGCPSGFTGGSRYWDDEDIGNANSASGSLPDGTYNDNTTIQFCCK